MSAGIRAAARFGLVGTSAMIVGVAGLRTIDLVGDAGLRRAVQRECEEAGVAMEALDVYVASPSRRLQIFEDMCGVAAEMGVPYVVAMGTDPDRRGLAEQLLRMRDIAEAHRTAVLIEVHPLTRVRSLADAAALVGEFGIDGVRVELDVLHFMRAGSTIDELRRHRDLVARVQWCDGMLGEPERGYLSEATSHRTVPGEGEFPLADILSALPPGVPIAVEVPHPALSLGEVTRRSIRGLREPGLLRKI